MKKFSEISQTLSLKPLVTGLVGEKIKIERILNKEVIMIGFAIKDSIHKIGTKCLHLQIEIESTKRVIFTSSIGLIHIFEQLSKEVFPFRATIVKNDDDRFELN